MKNQLFESVLRESDYSEADHKVYPAIGKWLNGEISDRQIKRIIKKEWDYDDDPEYGDIQSYLDWVAEDAYYEYAEDNGLTLD